MKKAFPMGEIIWRHQTTGVDGDVTLFGVNIFRYKWVPTGERITVRDLYRFPVYRVEIGGEEHIFAAGEFSNCVWGFYTPQVIGEGEK